MTYQCPWIQERSLMIGRLDRFYLLPLWYVNSWPAASYYADFSLLKNSLVFSEPNTSVNAYYNVFCFLRFIYSGIIPSGFIPFKSSNRYFSAIFFDAKIKFTISVNTIQNSTKFISVTFWALIKMGFQKAVLLSRWSFRWFSGQGICLFTLAGKNSSFGSW